MNKAIWSFCNIHMTLPIFGSMVGYMEFYMHATVLSFITIFCYVFLSYIFIGYLLFTFIICCWRLSTFWPSISSTIVCFTSKYIALEVFFFIHLCPNGSSALISTRWALTYSQVHAMRAGIEVKYISNLITCFELIFVRLWFYDVYVWLWNECQSYWNLSK